MASTSYSSVTIIASSLKAEGSHGKPNLPEQEQLEENAAKPVRRV